MSDEKAALCCVCGNLRTCRRPRNHKAENYWFADPIDRNWHREVGDLKCQECGRITRHAILYPERDTFRDHAERLTRIALGTTTDPMSNDARVKGHIQSAYRQGREPNPLLKHVWLTADEDAARKAGQDYVMTHCGEKQRIPKKTIAHPSDRYVEPDPVRWDQEYEDPATGLWWIEMDCVDCYRVSNERRMAERREHLREWLVWLLAKTDERVPDAHVDALIAAFKATQHKTAVRPEDSTR